jgi:dipeptidyl-peptidase 4
MMAYPNRSHSISEGPNTTLHLRELMTRYLEQNLPPGPKANAPQKAKTASEK